MTDHVGAVLSTAASYLPASKPTKRSSTGAAEEEGEEQKPQKTREAGEAAAAMDKVTDFAEEKEMRANVDKSKVQQAMAALAAEQAARKEAQRQRERELAAVKVQKADVELVAGQFDLDMKRAERCLREAKGDVRATLRSLLNV